MSATLLRRYRVSRYVHKGQLRALAFEDWADVDGVIYTVFKIEVTRLNAPSGRGRIQARANRADSQLNQLEREIYGKNRNAA